MPAYVLGPGRAQASAAAEHKFTYAGEHGSPLFQVRRTADKQFTQWSPDGRGGWRSGLHGARRVLYRLPEVIAAVAEGSRIWITEGEKDVHAAVKLGVIATTNPGGAGKWRDEYSAVLAGADVVIIFDRDPPGRRHALAVADSLKGVGARVRFAKSKVIRLHADLSDHVEAGYGLEQLVWGRPRAPAATRQAMATGASGSANGTGTGTGNGFLPAMYQLVELKLRAYAEQVRREPPKRHHDREAYEAICPGHDDQRQSLGVLLGDEIDVVLYCQAGCSAEEVVTALGIDYGEVRRARRVK